MSYSNAKLREICLKEAKDAEPWRAEFLLQLARNYEAAERDEPEGLSFIGVIAIAVLLYLLCLPIFWLASRIDERTEAPKGTIVEQIGGFTETNDGRYVARTFMFAPKEDFRSGRREFVFTEDAEPIIYEDAEPLPASNYEFQEMDPKNIWRFVTIKASDGSDPRRNGRRYYAVLPDQAIP